MLLRASPLWACPFSPIRRSLASRRRACWLAFAAGLLAAAPLRAAQLDPRPGSSEAAGSSPLWLRLRGGYERGSEPRERVFGMLELGAAFDALALGRSNALLVAAASDEAGEWTPPVPAGSSDAPPAVAAPGAPRPPRPGPEPAGPAVTPRLARAALLQAWRVVDAAAPPSQLDSLAARTRAAGGLPEVRVAAGTSRDQSLKLTPTLTDPARYTRDGGRDLWVEARLTWHLDRVVFSRDEVAVERLKAQAREERRRITRLVLDALLDYQRSRRTQASELSSDEERSAAELAELDATLRLDALTDGWFSRQLERAGTAEPPAASQRDACGSTPGGLQGPHGFGNPTGARGPQKARGCAKGASLTYRSSNAN